jgi:hypothetical protein
MIERILITGVAAVWAIAAAIAVAAPWNASPGQISVIAASGPTSTQILTSSSASVSGAGDRSFSVGYNSTIQSSDIASMVFPVSGVISGFQTKTLNAPTGAQTWVMSFHKNGAATSPAVTCTINASSSPAGTCSTAQAISVSAGDYGTVFSHPTGSPSTATHYVSMIFTPTTIDNTIIPGRGTAFSNSVQHSAIAFAALGTNTLVNRRKTTMPTAGALDFLYVNSNAPGAGTSYAYALAKNGSTTGSPPTCTIADTATICNDTSTGALTIADGDDIAFAATPTGTPSSASAGFGARFVPTTSGQFVFISNSLTAESTTVTRYLGLTGQISATETDVQNLVDSVTLTKMEVKLDGTAGGSGKTYTINDNASPTAATCNIGSGATTCSWSGSLAISSGHLVSISDVPSGTTNGRTAAVSIVANR